MTKRYSQLVHWLALLTTGATLILIFMGGLVTSHQAGMSVPDWPNSYGYNMFLFPPRYWRGNIFFEHTHRLMATLVGSLAIGLVVAAFRLEKRVWVRWVCAAVLGTVLFQGVLGGLRVVWVNLDLAIVHACVAQAFFCLAAFTSVITSKWWLNAPDLSHLPGVYRERRVIRTAVIAFATIYLQLVVGALMRHFKAGLAVPDLPFIYGQLLPPMTHAELHGINEYRAFHMNLGPVTLGQIYLHLAHRTGAILVFAMVSLLWLRVWRDHKNHLGLFGLSNVLFSLILLQISLGLATVYFEKPADLASTHVAVGALVLMVTFLIAVRAIRLYSLSFREDAASLAAPVVIDLPARIFPKKLPQPQHSEYQVP